MKERIDTTLRDLRIKLTQSVGEDARKAAQMAIDDYLASRLLLQIQHKKMEIAAIQADAAGYTGKGAIPD